MLLDASHLTFLDGLRITTRVRPPAIRFGERRSRQVGGFDEFVDYRPYVRGDDLRLVDWNVAARTDRLFLKQRIRETGLPVHLLLDASLSMSVGNPSPFEKGKEIALGLAYIALSHGDSVLLSSFGERLGATAEASTFSALVRLHDALERMPTLARTDVNRVLRTYAARSRRRGVAVVLSDLLDSRGFQEGVRAMVARGFEVFLVQLVAWEVERPPLEGDARLTDIETNESREVLWNADTSEAYTTRLRAFLKRVKDWCRAEGVPYVCVRTETPLVKIFHTDFREARIIDV